MVGMKWNLFKILLSAICFSCLFGALTCLVVKCGTFVMSIVKKHPAEPV